MPEILEFDTTQSAMQEGTGPNAPLDAGGSSGMFL
jgi:hypothetical protein